MPHTYDGGALRSAPERRSRRGPVRRSEFQADPHDLRSDTGFRPAPKSPRSEKPKVPRTQDSSGPVAWNTIALQKLHGPLPQVC